MEEITKHINDTNASYRHVGAGDAKNTDLFLDNDHFDMFRDCGDQVTVRFDKTNLTSSLRKRFCSLHLFYQGNLTNQAITML